MIENERVCHGDDFHQKPDLFVQQTLTISQYRLALLRVVASRQVSVLIRYVIDVDND
jgi:hypothetical protein